MIKSVISDIILEPSILFVGAILFNLPGSLGSLGISVEIWLTSSEVGSCIKRLPLGVVRYPNNPLFLCVCLPLIEKIVRCGGYTAYHMHRAEFLSFIGVGIGNGVTVTKRYYLGQR